MNSINLLPKELQVNKKLLLARHWSVMLTSIVLVVYIVGAAALLGWWFFLATEDNMTTQNIAAAQSQVKQISTTEALVRETAKREELIQSFIKNRVDVASLTATLVPVEEVTIDGYSYTAGAQKMLINVSQLSEMEKYTERLKPVYPNILNSSVTSSDGASWQIAIQL